MLGVVVPVDHDLTATFVWFNDDVDGLEIESLATFNISGMTAITSLVLGSEAEFPSYVYLSAITVHYLSGTADMYNETLGAVKIAWSDVGNLDFTINSSNVAGEAVMSWEGVCYHIKKLGNKVVVYGQNGITVMTPHGNAFGMETVYNIGVRNKGAVTGDDYNHFFVDNLGQLWQLNDKLTKLDYSEYLNAMAGTTLLSYDIEKLLVYICNGTYGYVYSVNSKSFGQGPVNLTGIYPKSGVRYVTCPSVTIATPTLYICTDIYDFGTRKPKTLESVDVGTNLANQLYTAIEFRTNYKSAFVSTPWFYVNPDGKSFPRCYGVEFKIKLRLLTYEYFELDYIKLRGHIHGFSYLDSFGRSGEN